MAETFISAGRAFLSLASDPSNYIVCGTRHGQGTNPMEGEIRHYAGDLAVPEVYDQTSRVLPVTLLHLGEVDLQRVLAWRGQIVTFRNTNGEVLDGIYLGVSDTRVLNTQPESDPSAEYTYNLDISIERVTFVEVP